MSFENLSDYARQLEAKNKKAYLKKIIDLGGVDPYFLDVKSFVLPLDDLPRITSETLTDFLIFRVSSETQTEIRAHKSLDAFSQFASNWIEEIKAQEINDCFCVIGKVLHSQRINEPSLRMWLTISKNGQILNCHCNCIAGLGEACTHVAAVLFALEYAGKQQQSVTDTLAYWIGPKTKKAFHKKIVDINFDSPHTLLKSVSTDKEIFYLSTDLPTESIPDLSEEDIMIFLKEYRNDGASCVLHMYYDEESQKKDWPYLSKLFDEQFCNMTLEELEVMAEEVLINVSEEMVREVEQVTHKQSKSTLWYGLRAGRITASTFHAVCSTKVNKPSLSLLKRICYPNLYKAVFQAGIYGCEHEKVALDTFQQIHQQTHASSLSSCGLFLSSMYPWCAATPDAILKCEICGICCVEVKCPYCARDSSIAEFIETRKKGCLTKTNEGVMLSKKHKYYYQVQMQMAVSNYHSCFFVVWSKQDVFIEKIEFSPEFWNEHAPVSKTFHKKVVLPELLGRYFTRKEQPEQQRHEEPSTSSMPISDIQNVKETKKWCFCKRPDEGQQMILCTNKNCPTKWYHVECLNLKNIPKRWFCDICK